MRRLIRLLVAAWMLIGAGSCISAAVIARTGHGQGFIVGWGQGEQWLVSLVIYGDGRAYARKFHINATTHRGPFITSAHGLIQPFYGVGLTTPHSHTVKVPMRSIVLASLVAGVLVFGVPWLRRRRRRRRNCCLQCGYPIGSSEVCTECGAALHQNRARQEAAGIAASATQQLTTNLDRPARSAAP